MRPKRKPHQKCFMFEMCQNMIFYKMRFGEDFLSKYFSPIKEFRTSIRKSVIKFIDLTKKIIRIELLNKINIHSFGVSCKTF